MAKGEFHVFPDSMAKQISEAYAGFAAGVIEAAGNGRTSLFLEYRLPYQGDHGDGPEVAAV